MPRNVVIDGRTVGVVKPRQGFPSPTQPPDWFTLPSFNSPIMDTATNTLGIPWYNLLTFITTRASFINELHDQIVTVGGDVTTLQGQVATLQSQVGNLQGRMNTAESNISSLQSSVSTLQGQMSTANSNISTLQSQMSTANANITNLQGRVTSIEQRLAAAGIP